MKNFTLFLAAILLAFDTYACAPLLDHEVRTLDGLEEVRLCEEYAGKVVLIVNTASKCAYTDQYAELEALYRDYKGEGLVVLGFPSNDFGAQEPGTEKQIKSFCRLTYGVRFPMYGKTRVSRYAADPLFRDLAEASGRYPAWNFHKYLLDRQGELVADYQSAVNPIGKEMLPAIRRELGKKF